MLCAHESKPKQPLILLDLSSGVIAIATNVPPKVPASIEIGTSADLPNPSAQLQCRLATLTRGTNLSDYAGFSRAGLGSYLFDAKKL